VLRVPDAVKGSASLGYPLHFIVLLGVWKVLGALTLLVPKFPLVKEWAYAGIFIDLTGAVVAQSIAGEGGGNAVGPAVAAAVLVASWWLRPEGRRLVSAWRPGSAAAASS
jgi:hypothetical protein